MGNDGIDPNVARETFTGPVEIGDPVSEFMRKFRAVEGPAAVERAREQEERQSYEKALAANLNDWLGRWLKRAGVSYRERFAEVLRVPAAVASVIKHEAGDIYASMVAGEIPGSGFGLTGNVGTGKTFALVCAFRNMVRARWIRNPSRETVTENWLAWRRWPEMAAELRVIAARDQGGYAEAEGSMKKLAVIPALVLDDLGGERVRSDEYEADWVTSMLDLLIDRRNGSMLPTWYTTNLTRGELLDRYGARLFSRLCGENKLIAIPAGPDLRIVR